MSRKNSNFKRDVLPDPKYGSELISKYINMVMKSGKKSVAEKIVYGAMAQIAEKEKGNVVELTQQALEKVRPRRQMALAMRWTIEAARKRGEANMPLKLAGEMMDALHDRGAAMKRREEVHKMAEANKAFAHYRW